MSMTQISTERSPSGSLHCPRCDATLPPHATFCGSCGERLKKKESLSLAQHEVDISPRYSITSPIRRLSYVSLSFATDTEQQRPVAIRDIDISSLDSASQANTVEIARREYDLLRRWRISGVMPVIDLRYFQSHLYVVTSWFNANSATGQLSAGVVGTQSNTPLQRLYTLHDVLQSGISLPNEQIVLAWMERLCRSIEALHTHSIVLGNLDPSVLILNNRDYVDAQPPALMISWLPAALTTLLPPSPPAMTFTSYFSAPEALLGQAETRSDVYSLGAILYFLLTGTPPDEPARRTQQRMRSPREINSSISSSIEEIVMRALALERSARFPSPEAMAEVLSDLRSGATRSPSQQSSFPAPTVGNQQPQSVDKSTQHLDDIASIDTILIPPLPRAIQNSTPTHWQPPGHPTPLPIPAPSMPPMQPTPRVLAASSPETPFPDDDDEAPVESTAVPQWERLKRRITGILPALPRTSQQAQAGKQGLAPLPAGEPSQPTKSPHSGSLFKQLQRSILGQQQHKTKVAAVIETPLRIQPNQTYAIRIRLMGRDTPEPPSGGGKHEQPVGLSALAQGNIVSVEVRSALYQSFAYIVQEASISMPGQGYAAEVVIPMQPLTSGPSGRRDRLHIFFLDGTRRPLYDKPFVVELFISHLVQPGREGHNVLTIPF